MVKTMWRRGKGKKSNSEKEAPPQKALPDDKVDEEDAIPPPITEDKAEEDAVRVEDKVEEEDEEEDGEADNDGEDEDVDDGEEEEEDDDEADNDEEGEDVDDGEEEEEKDSEEEEDGEERDIDDGEAEEEENNHESHSNGEVAMVTEVETEAMQPLMWFPNSEYGKRVKIVTKCYLHKAVATLEKVLEPEELGWFHEHPQFCHMFHMPKDKNHKTMGMWLLILRKAQTEKKKEAWFVVNGVPIRYSLREHAIMSGLNCHQYPVNYQTFGNVKFVEKHFKKEKPTYEAVEKKFVSMKYSPDRLKIAVLYFLSSIIIGNAKVKDGAPMVEEIFRRAVTDLEWCKTFPWGRLSFENTMNEILHMVERCNGVANPYWCIPSFIIPMELLAFEAIHVLKKKFREKVKGACTGCPRMCKSKFKKSSMRGFPLSYINDGLGNTKDIQSIIEPTEEEAPLMLEIIEGIDNDDNCDATVDNWTRILEVEKKKIWFEGLYHADVQGRKVDIQAVSKAKVKGKEKETVVEENMDLKELIEVGLKKLGETMSNMETKVTEKLGELDKKMTHVLKFVPLMEVANGMENVVVGGEVSTGKEKAVASAKDNEVIGGEVLTVKEKAVSSAKENEAANAKEADKKKTKKRKISYSKLVEGHFKKPNTRSRITS